MHDYHHRCLDGRRHLDRPRLVRLSSLPLPFAWLFRAPHAHLTSLLRPQHLHRQVVGCLALLGHHRRARRHHAWSWLPRHARRSLRRIRYRHRLQLCHGHQGPPQDRRRCRHVRAPRHRRLCVRPPSSSPSLPEPKLTLALILQRRHPHCPLRRRPRHELRRRLVGRRLDQPQRASSSS